MPSTNRYPSRTNSKVPSGLRHAREIEYSFLVGVSACKFNWTPERTFNEFSNVVMLSDEELALSVMGMRQALTESDSDFVN
jgi:hypothetical protein